MNIKLLKLTSGEEIVAEVEEREEKLALTNVVTFMPTHEGMAMVPWLMMADDSSFPIEINRMHVIWDGKPHEDIVNAYNAKFGSGIVVPEKGNIIV